MNTAILNSMRASKIAPWLPNPDLLTEDFESGSIPSGWTTDAGSPNYGYPSIPYAEFGKNQSRTSLALFGSGDGCRGALSATSEIYVYFQWIQLAENNATNRIFSLDSGAGNGLILEWNANKMLYISDNGQVNYANPTTPIVLNQRYHIWLHYKAGTGANAVLSVAFNNEEQEPVSGTGQFASMSNGVSTTSPDRAKFWNGGGAGGKYVFDHLGVATFPMHNGW